MKVIVIGAGAAGLMAAYELSRKGIGVTVLESGQRIGGRIHTLVPPGFSNHVEAGAEFIHGELPLTLQFARKARLPLAEASGNSYAYQNGQLRAVRQGKAWDEFYAALGSVRQDLSMREFLDHHFPNKKYEALRQQVADMAQGLDLADVDRLSVTSIQAEWLSEQTQYRLVSGYGPLLEFMRNQSLEHCELHLGVRARTVRWKKGAVEVLCDVGSFAADAVIVTVSLGVLQQRQIQFDPPIARFEELFSHIGFGSVIKFALEFNDRFWEQKRPDIGFLFAQGGLTFWTQRSIESPVLTGWIGDAYVHETLSFSDDELIDQALGALEVIFKKASVRQMFRAGAVYRYTSDAVSAGGYSWRMPQSLPAIEEVNKGIVETVWFAGEAFCAGEVGTVEAALRSGSEVVERLRKFEV